MKIISSPALLKNKVCKSEEEFIYDLYFTEVDAFRMYFNNIIKTGVPKNIIFRHDVSLYYVRSISHLKSELLFDNVTIMGTLSMQEVSCTKKIAKNLTVFGDLCLYSCVHLEKIADNLTVYGNVEINSCNLNKIADNFLVQNDIVIKHCSRLEEISDVLICNKNVVMKGLYDLNKIPEILSIKLIFSIKNCPEIKNICKVLSDRRLKVEFN